MTLTCFVKFGVFYKTTWMFGMKWNDILIGLYTSNGARRRTPKQ